MIGKKPETPDEQAAADHSSAAGALGRQATVNRGRADVDTQALLDAITDSSEATAAALILVKVATRRFIITVALILVVIALIGAIVLGYLHGQDRRAARADEQRQAVVATQRQLADCVLPTGTCYKRGQAQTAQAVGAIGQQQAAAAAAAAACAQTLRGYPAIKACVDKALTGAR